MADIPATHNDTTGIVSHAAGAIRVIGSLKITSGISGTSEIMTGGATISEMGKGTLAATGNPIRMIGAVMGAGETMTGETMTGDATKVKHNFANRVIIQHR